MESSVIIPNYLLPAIYNDDRTHLNDEEEKELESFWKFIDGFNVGDFVDVGFKYRNDVNSLGADCSEVKLHKVN